METAENTVSAIDPKLVNFRLPRGDQFSVAVDTFESQPDQALVAAELLTYSDAGRTLRVKADGFADLVRC